MQLSVRPHYPLQLPPLPQIPIDLNQGEREFLTSLDGKIDSILVAGREADKLSVMGNKGGKLYFSKGSTISYDSDVGEYVTIDREPKTGQVEVSSFQGPNYRTLKDITIAVATAGLYIAYFESSAAQRERRKRQCLFHLQATRLIQNNLDDITEKIKDIRLYQGAMEEVERDLGRPLERVDTQKPETYLHKEDPFWLRVEAYLLGANAIVHYQPGSSIGTPVRFK